MKGDKSNFGSYQELGNLEMIEPGFVEPSITRIYADKNYKKELFDNSKNFLIGILNNDLLYNGFFNGINYSNQKRFNQMLISENCEEYLLLRNIYDTKMKMNNKITTLKNKLEDYMEIKDFNDKLVHSNSWKITRPFRII